MTTMTIHIHQVHDGDTISLDQPPETYSDNKPGTYQPGEPLKVIRKRWHSATQRHMIDLDSEHQHATVAFDSATSPVTLHSRPGFGPFDAVYQVGDKVLAMWMHHIHPGVVTEVTHSDDDVVYTVCTWRNTSAYVGPENMCRDMSPLPAEGQQWVCRHGRHEGMVLTVLKADGLEAVCQDSTYGNINTYVLASANYGLTVETAPEPIGTPGEDYVDVEMIVLESTRMVRIFR